MALLEAEVTGAKQAVVHLEGYSRHIRDFRDLWPEIVDAFVAREQLWFGKEGEGSWPALSPEYAAWKAVVHPGKPKLVLSGDLKRSLTDPSRAKLAETDHMLVLGSSDPKAAWHQHGTGRMPARPPLIPVLRLKAAIARLLDVWVDYRPGGWGQNIRRR
jgi:phage gpG-like protein